VRAARSSRHRPSAPGARSGRAAGPVLPRLVFGAALAATAVACGRSREPVRIGVELEPSFAAPAAMAAAEINRAGGVRGRRLELVRDELPPGAPDEPAYHLLRALSVLRVPLVAVIGHGGSRSSLAAAPAYNHASVLQIVPTGTSRLLARAGPWTLALPPNDSVEGSFIAAFVRGRLRARSVVTFFVNSEYGVGLRDGVRAALAGSGIRQLREVRYDSRADLPTLVDAALLRGTPDVAIVAGYTQDAGAIARHLRRRGSRAAVVVGDGAHVLPDLVIAAGEAAQGIFVVTFWLPSAADSAARRLEMAVRAQFGREPAARDAMVYDAVRLLATAIEAVGDDSRRVRGYLLSLGVDRPRYRGVTGEIGFGAGAGPPRFVMGVVRDSLIVPAEVGTR